MSEVETSATTGGMKIDIMGVVDIIILNPLIHILVMKEFPFMARHRSTWAAQLTVIRRTSIQWLFIQIPVIIASTKNLFTREQSKWTF